MADGNSGNGGLYFIVGALCVAVAVGGFFLFGGQLGPSTAQAPAPAAPTKNIDIKIETPKVIERTERKLGQATLAARRQLSAVDQSASCGGGTLRRYKRSCLHNN